MQVTFDNWYNRKITATTELAAETRLVEEFLPAVKTIAIVGISRNPHRDSSYVGQYLQNAGYKIVPVNPGANEILGEKSYPTLDAIPFELDVVDIFRRPEDIPAVVDEAIALKPKVIWCQLGTGDHPEIRKKAEALGINFIQKRCIKVDHQFLIREQIIITH